MENIWKNKIGELGVETLSSFLKTRLCTTLKDSFENDTSKWESYCEKIASSKFLMGEANNKFFKKAWITWAIRPENIERIQAGDFQIGDRAQRELVSEPSDQDVEGIIQKQPSKLREFIKDLATRLGNSTFVAWFQQVEFYWQGASLMCQTPTRFMRDYIKNNFEQMMFREFPFRVSVVYSER